MKVLLPTFYEPAARAEPPTATAGPVPAVLILPAMGVPAGAYRRLAHALTALDTAVAVVEWRGTGASPVQPGRRADWGYPELLEQETLGGLAATHARWPGRPVVLLGHSLGGHIAVMARARAAPGLNGVLLVAAGTPHHRTFAPDISRKLNRVVLLNKLVSPVVGHYPGDRLGFGGRQPRRLITQWSQLARTGQLRLAGADPFAARAPQAVARIPVRALSLAQDHFAPWASTAELLHRAGVPESVIERYAGPGPTGHFDWLKDPAAIARRIVEVLDELQGAAG